MFVCFLMIPEVVCFLSQFSLLSRSFIFFLLFSFSLFSFSLLFPSSLSLFSFSLILQILLIVMSTVDTPEGGYETIDGKVHYVCSVDHPTVWLSLFVIYKVFFSLFFTSLSLFSLVSLSSPLSPLSLLFSSSKERNSLSYWLSRRFYRSEQEKFRLRTVRDKSLAMQFCFLFSLFSSLFSNSIDSCTTQHFQLLYLCQLLHHSGLQSLS